MREVVEVLGVSLLVEAPNKGYSRIVMLSDAARLAKRYLRLKFPSAKFKINTRRLSVPTAHGSERRSWLFVRFHSPRVTREEVEETLWPFIGYQGPAESPRLLAVGGKKLFSPIDHVEVVNSADLLRAGA